MKRSWLFLAFGTAFLVLKLVNLAPQVSDENLYFYAAQLVANGVVPYRDFFFQHPPTQILLLAFLIKLFGFRLFAFKLVHVLVTLGSAFLLYRLTGSKRGAMGLFASLFFLSSSVIFTATDFAVGVHEATFFLILSWYLLGKRPKLAGLALFLGLTIRMYILPAGLGLAAYAFWRGNRRGTTHFLLYSLVPFALFNLVLLGLFGEGFLTPVWRYHFLKPTVEIRQQAFTDFFRNEKFLLLFSAASAFILLRRAVAGRWIFPPAPARLSGDVHLGLAAAFGLAAQFIFLSRLPTVFLIYFVTVIPFLAVLASLTLAVFLPARSRKAAYLFVVLVFGLNALSYEKNMAGKYAFGALDDIVADVRKVTGARETIFGAYLVTPAVALYSDRSITDHEVDTNTQRFMTGLLSAETSTRLATSSGVFLQSVIFDEGTGAVRNVDPFVDPGILVESCRPHRMYPVDQDFGFNRLVLWKCS